MHPARSGDRNVVGGDRHLPDRGIGFLRRGDRYTKDRWNVSGGVIVVPPTGLNDGDPVSLWKDSSTGGHDASQTGTARPTFKTNILNGKPVVRYAAGNSLVLASSIPSSSFSNDWTSFTVWKATPGVDTYGLLSANGDSRTAYFRADGYFIPGDSQGWGYAAPGLAGVFRVFTVKSATSGSGQPPTCWLNGTSTVLTNFGGGTTVPFDTLGLGPSDIAEVIHYNGYVAIRAKLLVVLTVLISTGEIPSPDEADALLAAGDLVGLEAYLIEHGVPVEQARDTLEPMAVGDRANIEKYLGTKYGITVAGGTAADPSTVAGLVGWWKADSLAGSGGTGPGLPFDPTTIAGLKGWWKTDAIAGPPADGATVNAWNDSSSNAYNLTGNTTFKASILNGKPVLRFDGGGNYLHNAAEIGINQPFTMFFVGKGRAATNVNFIETNIGAYGCIIAMGPGGFGIYAGVTIQDTIDHTGAFHVCSGVFNGASSEAYLDTMQVATGNAGSSRIGQLVVMAAYNLGSAYPGDVAEILIYNSKLSTTDRQNVENYLIDKYGLRPMTIPGLKAWWAADNITIGSLLREDLKDRIKEMDKPTPQNE